MLKNVNYCIHTIIITVFIFSAIVIGNGTTVLIIQGGNFMKFFNIRKRVSAVVVAFAMIIVSTSLTAFAVETPAEPIIEASSEQPTIIIQRIGDADSTSDVGVSTYASKTYVNRAGMLAPGGSISGTFQLTGWLGIGNEFTVEAGAGNTGGSLSLSLGSSVFYIPCDGQDRVICSESGWSSGTYSYTIYNGTGNTTGYALTIYKP